MSKNFNPAQRFHVGEFVRDEMEARGWSQSELAERMGGNFDENYLVLDLMLLEDPHMTLGQDTANQLAKAFEGTDPQTWLNLDASWRAWKTQQS